MDFASEENPNKNVARYMMRMNTKINKKYFKDKENKNSTIQAVTCYTCHHGKGDPAVKPGPGGEGSMGMPPPPPGGMRPPAPGDSSKGQH